MNENHHQLLLRRRPQPPDRSNGNSSSSSLFRPDDASDRNHQQDLLLVQPDTPREGPPLVDDDRNTNDDDDDRGGVGNDGVRDDGGNGNVGGELVAIVRRNHNDDNNVTTSNIDFARQFQILYQELRQSTEAGNYQRTNEITEEIIRLGRLQMEDAARQQRERQQSRRQNNDEAGNLVPILEPPPHHSRREREEATAAEDEENGGGEGDNENPLVDQIVRDSLLRRDELFQLMERHRREREEETERANDGLSIDDIEQLSRDHARRLEELRQLLDRLRRAQEQVLAEHGIFVLAEFRLYLTIEEILQGVDIAEDTTIERMAEPTTEALILNKEELQEEGEDDGLQCSICVDPLLVFTSTSNENNNNSETLSSDGCLDCDPIAITQKCNHRFHEKCLATWLQTRQGMFRRTPCRSCPLCRETINEADNKFVVYTKCKIVGTTTATTTTEEDSDEEEEDKSHDTAIKKKNGTTGTVTYIGELFENVFFFCFIFLCCLHAPYLLWWYTWA